MLGLVRLTSRLIAASCATLLACLGSGQPWNAGSSDSGTRASLFRDGDAIVATSASGTARIHFVGPAALEISTIGSGGKGPIAQPVSSLIDPAFRPRTGAILSARFSPGTAYVRTSDARVEIDANPVEVRIYGRTGRLITRILDPASGAIQLSHTSGQLYGIDSSDVWGNIEDGLARADGGIVRSGIQGSANGPWIFSTEFGLLVDATAGQFFADPGRLTFRPPQDQTPPFYVLIGPPKSTLSQAAALTGLPPMLPKWAFGFLNSQWGINQEQLESIVATYRQKDIPLTAFALDFDYKAWGEDNYGEFRWNDALFPDGASGALADRLRRQNVSLIGIMKPRVIVRTASGALTRAGQDLETLGCGYPGQAAYDDYFARLPARDIDFSKPECRAWFWTRSREFHQSGIVGWWNDEADIDAAGFVFDQRQGIGMARAMYEGQRTDGPDRVFNLNRNFFFGAQRYAYALWSGDIESSFDSMARQPVRMLASANVGASAWTMDAGGFINKPPASSETYARWMAFAAVTPIMRVHGYQNEKRQPWLYGSAAEAAAAQAIRFRRRLFPYIYAHERIRHETGIGLVRPMVVEFPDDGALANATGQWMFGRFLLASPVLAAGQTSHTIYLPRGTWTNYATGERYSGPGTIDSPITPGDWNALPLFVREGAIIPALPDGSGDPARVIDIDVFAGPETTSFDYYDDDGATYAYEEGAYFSQTFQARRANGQIEITIGPAQGSYPAGVERYQARLVGARATAVQLNGVELQKAASLDALRSMSQGWLATRDGLGEATLIKIPARTKARIVAVEASPAVTQPIRAARDNLALNATAVASSFETPDFRAANAVDGDSNTRWSSLATETAWLIVDLGREAALAEITLNWETATARDYTLETADTPTGPWQRLAVIENNQTVGRVSHRVEGRGRYVRLSLTRRSGDWGYSLYDFEVFGAPTAGAPPSPQSCSREPGARIETLRSGAGPGEPWAPAAAEALRRLEVGSDALPGGPARIRGKLCPPYSGYYVFSLASAGKSEFRLGQSDGPPLAEVIRPAGERQWRVDVEQRSAPVYLTAAQPIDFEIRWPSGGPAGPLALAWEGPALSRRIIDGTALLSP